MTVPDLYLAVYIGFCYADSKPVAKIINKCGFKYMNYGGNANSNDWFEMGFFKNHNSYMKLNLKNNEVTRISRGELLKSVNVIEVDINDLKKCIKGEGHLDIDKILSFPKYQNSYKEKKEKIRLVNEKNEEIRKKKILEEEKYKEELFKRLKFEEIERKKRKEKLYIEEEKRYNEEYLYRIKQIEESRELSDFEASAYGYPQLTHYE